MWRGKSSYAITTSVQVVGGMVSKLSSYRTIEYIEQNCRVIELSSISSKTVQLSNCQVYRAKLSSNRTIEYIEQNCPAIEHLLQSCRVIEHIEHVLQNSTKTVEHWNRPITRQFCSIYSIVR